MVFIRPEDIITYDVCMTYSSTHRKKEVDDNLTALIDADTLVVNACQNSQLFNEGTNEMEVNLAKALEIAREKVDRITEEAGCGQCKLFFTGSNNFRYIIYPNYKANRTSELKGRQELAKMLGEYYYSVYSDEYQLEADDTIIAYYEASENNVLCAIDKDVIYAIEGKHYNPYYKPSYTNNRGKVMPAITPTFVEVSREEAFIMPYYQCLLGDSVDNIQGVKGIGKVSAKKILEEVEEGDDSRANYLVLSEYVKSMCTVEAYTAFEYGLKVTNGLYDPIMKDPTTMSEAELDYNYASEVYLAVKYFECTMQAVNMRQAEYNFIDDTYSLELWKFPVDENNIFEWD